MTVTHTMAVYECLYQAQLLHFVVRKKPLQKTVSEQCNRQMYQFCNKNVCSGNGDGNLLLLTPAAATKSTPAWTVKNAYDEHSMHKILYFYCILGN